MRVLATCLIMSMFDKLRTRAFQVLALHHAEAILMHDMPEAIREIEAVLMKAKLPVEELVRGGGGEGKLTQRLRHALYEAGWQKHSFVVQKVVDGSPKESTSHEIDHVKKFDSGSFALEIEWNNKDPFFDRDLENFKRLHADGAISIGGIITRGESLQSALRDLIERFARKQGIDSISKLAEYYEPTTRQKEMIKKAVKTEENFEKGWAHAFVSDKFGEATTHWGKLSDRVSRGVGNPCPLLLIGLPKGIVTF